LHEYIVPFIRRQSRAYLLASITGMQGKLPGRPYSTGNPDWSRFRGRENIILEYLDKLMKQLVGQAYQLSTNAGPE